MKYLLLTPQIETQIAEIKSKIRLSMNGVVADSMINAGINYKKNFGVSVPRIKELAAAYTPSVDLAQGLWAQKIRETMLMAALLMPKDKFTVEMANNWVTEINHTELAEQLSMQLFAQTPIAPDLCSQWVTADSKWIRVTGFMLAARVYKQLTPEQIKALTNRALELATTDDSQLYKSIGLCLSRFCRNSTETATYISGQLAALYDSSLKSHQYITNEVTQELLFLGIL